MNTSNLFLFLVTLLFAYEVNSEEVEIPDEISSNIFLKSVQNLESPIPLATLEGEPSAIVNYVNVITGQLCLSETDIVMQHGVDPFYITRQFLCSTECEGLLGDGWTLNHSSEIQVAKKMPFDNGNFDVARLIQDHGGALFFSKKPNESLFKIVMIDGAVNEGFTNTSAGWISGQTNLKNLKIDSSNPSCYELILGTGGKKFFKHISHDKPFLRLIKETRPSGNSFKYRYLLNNRHNYLSSIEFVNQANKLTDVLELKPLTQNRLKGDREWKIVTTHGDWVFYKFKTGSNHKHFLSSVERSDGTKEEYSYLSKRRIDILNSTTYHLLKRKNLPENRYLAIEYYDVGSNPTVAGNINLRRSTDARIDRVRNLYAPAGTNASPILIYQFIYDINIVTDKYGKHDANGACHVFDALKRRSMYTFDALKRLNYIDKFKENSSHYTRETLYWGDDAAIDSSCLIGRKFEVVGGETVFVKRYQYDAAGNVLTDSLYGNLTGNNLIAPLTHISGVPQENGCDCYKKNFEYSNDGLNLLLKETDGIQTTSYIYLQGTNRLIGKFQGSNDRPYLRWFYLYNDDGAVIREISDDGSSFDWIDLTGVTERHFKDYTQRQTYPVAYPDIIEKKYLDLTTGQEILESKIVNHYCPRGRIIQQDHYDNQGTFSHSQFWEYDQRGNIIKEIDPIGRSIERRFDANGNCIYEQLYREDFKKYFFYDFMNRLIREEEDHSDGKFTNSYRYDLTGNRLASVDSYGNETLYDYDAFGRVIKIIYPEICNQFLMAHHPIVEKAYDALGNEIKIVDGRGAEVTSRYTIRKQLAFTQFPDGTSEARNYYLNGWLKETIAKNGSITRYQYDPLGRVTKTETLSSNGELISSTNATYSGFQLLTETDAKGIVTEYGYFLNGKLKSKKREDSLTTYSYDNLNRLSKTTEYYGPTLNEVMIKTESYDLLNRVIEEKIGDVNGQTLTKIKKTYDISGNVAQLTTYQNGQENSSTTVYNTHGGPIISLDAEGNCTTTKYCYDHTNALGQKVAYKEITDPLGNRQIIIEDAFGSVVDLTRKNAFGKVIQHQEIGYDANRNQMVLIDHMLNSTIPDEKIVTLINYNLNNQMIAMYEANGTPHQKETKITYNRFGQKDKFIKYDGVAIQHTYDDLGRLSSLSSSDHSIDYVYQYDLNSNPVCVLDNIQKTATNRLYDGNNRILQEELSNGLTIKYQYDGLGRPKKITFPNMSGIEYTYHSCLLKKIERKDSKENVIYTHHYENYDLSGKLLKSNLPENGGTIEYQYDKIGRIKTTCHPKWTETLSYNKVGNIFEKFTDIDGNQQVFHYTYDDLYQLSSEDGATQNSYAHDSHFNRVSKNEHSHSLNALHHITNDGYSDYDYDLNGNLMQRTNGEGSARFLYDALNRLTTFQEGDLKACYTYDENNRRQTKALFELEGNDWKKIADYRYLYQGQNEIGCYDERNTLTELRILGQGKGAEIGAAIAIEMNNELYIPIHDIVGNVSCILNSKGEVIETYQYSAYGEELFNDALIPWRYASKRLDSESGLLYFGRRYYDPSIGRWITPDPIGRDGGVNLYAYVMNSPLTHFDLYGLFRLGIGSLGNGITSSTRLLSNILKFPGRVLEFLGHNLTPIPYVQDAIEFAGWCLAGKNPCAYTPNWKREHSKLYVHSGYGDGDPHLRHITYNGICTSKKTLEKRCASISENYGGVTVYGIYNASHGFVSDIVEVLCQKLGIRTNSQNKAQEITAKIISDMGNDRENGKLIVHAHSQGAETVHNLCPHVRKMMDVTAYGPARVLNKNDFFDAHNFISFTDPVTALADPIGFVRGICNNNISFVKNKGCPLKAHDFAGPSYSSIYGLTGFNFKTHYGSVE